MRHYRRYTEAFSLIEILVAMFIFLIGILGVLSMFPVAMNSAGKTMGAMRALTLGRSAIAQMRLDCALPYEIGTLTAASDTDAVCSTIFSEDWAGWFLTTLAPPADSDSPPGPAHQHCRILVSAPLGDNRISVYPAWNPMPDPNTEFVITRFGLPDPMTESESRYGYVREFTPSGFRAGKLRDNSDDIDPKSWPSLWESPVIPAGLYPEHPGYFVLFTSGQASGRILPIDKHNPDPINGDELVCDGLEPELMRVDAAKRAADGGLYEYKAQNATSFVILGTLSAVCTFHPHPNREYRINSFGRFGVGEIQTYPDIYFAGNEERLASEYSSIMIFGSADTDSAVEVYNLTFRNYDHARPISKNKRALGYLAAYLKRP